MLKKFLTGLLVGMYCSLACLGEAAGITNYEKFITAAYWQQQNPNGNRVLLDAKGIKNYNAQIVALSRTVVDLKNYPTTYSGDSLKTRIMNYAVLDDDLYLRGNRVSENYKNILRQQTNADAVPDQVKVQYAVTVRRCDVRGLPTGEGLFYSAGDRFFDVLQETSLDPGEPLVVLHKSANGYFYYCQTTNYSGWVSKFNMALTDRNTWLQYLEPKSFVVVTDSKLPLKVGNEILTYQQGSRMPIIAQDDKTYTLLAAGRSNNGNYTKMTPMLRKDNPAVHLGYLPYTANNILQSAFKFYGTPYGWGGKMEGVDCSALIYNVYRTVGVYLPRNADEQETTAGKGFQFEGMDENARLSQIKLLTPGAGLYLDGHCLLYLGQSGGVPYVIQALASTFPDGERQTVMSVVVSDLNLERASGNTICEELTTAVEFR